MIIDKLKQGALVTVDSLEDMMVFLKYVEDFSDIVWSEGQEPTGWLPDNFDKYKQSTIAIGGRGESPILKYCSLEYFNTHVTYAGLPMYSYKELFNFVRRF